jgi:WD40-like Beta Propeller Repeat
MIALEGDAKPRLFAPFAQTVAISPVFSPDGRWVAYTTRVDRAAAIRQVFVQSYPDFKAKYQISEEGGVAPLWSPKGTQLLYSSLGGSFSSDGAAVSLGRVFAVALRVAPTFSIVSRSGIPIPRVNLPEFSVRISNSRSYDITPDGKQFIVVTPERLGDKPPPPQINVAVNWTEELKQRLPTR